MPRQSRKKMKIRAFFAIFQHMAFVFLQYCNRPTTNVRKDATVHMLYFPNVKCKFLCTTRVFRHETKWDPKRQKTFLRIPAPVLLVEGKKCCKQFVLTLLMAHPKLFRMSVLVFRRSLGKENSKKVAGFYKCDGITHRHFLQEIPIRIQIE